MAHSLHSVETSSGAIFAGECGESAFRLSRSANPEASFCPYPESITCPDFFM